jgi:hypothetical protein
MILVIRIVINFKIIPVFRVTWVYSAMRSLATSDDSSMPQYDVA